MLVEIVVVGPVHEEIGREKTEDAKGAYRIPKIVPKYGSNDPMIEDARRVGFPMPVVAVGCLELR